MTANFTDDAKRAAPIAANRVDVPREKVAAVLIWSLFICVFAAPYHFFPWWKFFPATVVMLVCQRYLQGDDWRRVLGLAANRRTWLRAALLMACVAIGGHFLVHSIAAGRGILRVGPWLSPFRLLPLCQVLNEEMVFRALMLGLCVRCGAGVRWVSWLSATVFVTSHILLYRFGSAHTWLLPQTVVTLLCFALLTNEMYLRTGNIAYPIAVHLGWNFTRFGAAWQFPDASWPASEVYGFNTFEAHPIVVLASVLALAVTRVVFQTNTRNSGGSERLVWGRVRG